MDFPGYSEKTFAFTISKWASGVERQKIIEIVSDLVPEGSSVVITKDAIMLEVVFGNEGKTHLEHALEFQKRLTTHLHESGIKAEGKIVAES